MLQFFCPILYVLFRFSLQFQFGSYVFFSLHFYSFDGFWVARKYTKPKCKHAIRFGWTKINVMSIIVNYEEKIYLKIMKVLLKRLNRLREWDRERVYVRVCVSGRSYGKMFEKHFPVINFVDQMENCSGGRILRFQANSR